MISRRELLVLPALAAACSDDTTDMQSKIKPWHMWGGTADVNVTDAAASSSHQIVDIQYDRPITWKFMFAAQVLSSTSPRNGITVVYDLTLGVGRSQVKLSSFALLSWMAGAAAAHATPLYVTTVPDRYQTNPSTGNVLGIDQIPFSSCQVVATCFLAADPAPPQSARVAVSAFFAPISHIRPEWFL